MLRQYQTNKLVVNKYNLVKKGTFDNFNIEYTIFLLITYIINMSMHIAYNVL
jgi:hypothetical protein